MNFGYSGAGCFFAWTGIGIIFGMVYSSGFGCSYTTGTGTGLDGLNGFTIFFGISFTCLISGVAFTGAGLDYTSIVAAAFFGDSFGFYIVT